MGVLFTITDGFDDLIYQKCMLPAYLPEKPPEPRPKGQGYPSPFQRAWPDDPPFNRPPQFEWVLKFSQIPSELVCRLIVDLTRELKKVFGGKMM
jgi:hypothetical protein